MDYNESVNKKTKRGDVMTYLCIDVGGTFIKYALFDKEGTQLVSTQKVATQIEEQDNHILKQILEIVAQAQQEQTLSGIAIATAGVVDSQTGGIRYSGYTIPNYTGTPIKREVEAASGVPCAVINDVNAACLGEYWKGFSKSEHPNSMVCLTIGTGVGGAVLIDGKLHAGATDMAGEIGYLPINGECFQDLASTTALLQKASEAIGYDMTGEQFFEKLSLGQEPILQTVFEKFVSDLATGLVTIQYLLNPEVIVLGGGILAQSHIILPALHEAMKQIAIDERFLSAEVKEASLGNNAGMLGALHYLLTHA